MAVTASSEQQRLLLDVQALDTKLLQLAHKRAGVPQVKETQDLEVALGSLDMQIVAAKTHLSDLSLGQAKAESDVEQVRSRAARDQERLDSGAVNAVKELESLQHEIVSLSRRQAELEEVELEIMQQVEESQQILDRLVHERADTEQQLETKRAELTEIMADLDAAKASMEHDRAGIANDVPSDLLAFYDKIRADLGGVGASMLHRASCQGCHIAVDATELQRIRGIAPEVVVRCEECRRILVRTSESGL
ncbi:MAG: C4-type zinc ribbon domain-containing protein [Actinomycetes bacterium]